MGEPNFFPSTTLRPFGPSVTRTAFASVSTPRSIALRASSLNVNSLAGTLFLLLFLGRSSRLFCGAPDSHTRRTEQSVSHPEAATIFTNDLSVHLGICVGSVDRFVQLRIERLADRR